MITDADIQLFLENRKVPPLKDIEEWLDSHENTVRIVKEMKRLAEGRTKVRCPSCNKVSQIGRMVYIQTHFYVEPWGCTGGDYYSAGEGQAKCPKCESIMRFYNMPEIEELRFSFKDIVNEYKR